jgi:hypothetical protein
MSSRLNYDNAFNAHEHLHLPALTCERLTINLLASGAAFYYSITLMSPFGCELLIRALGPEKVIVQC